MEKQITRDEIKQLILERGLTLSDVIDSVIELNGYIGVGLITLGQQLDKYCKDKINKNLSFD